MKTPTDFHRGKNDGEKIVMMTAYDYPGARLCEEAGIDVILVGDSLGMVVLGYDSTVPVTLADMTHHTRAVRRGAGNTFILTDMPFLTYQISPAQALENAARLMQDGGCDGVKLEGGAEMTPQIRALTTAGIPVCGHVGLTPQSATALGGYKVQGRTAEAARKLLDDAFALEEAGAFMIVVECVPAPVGKLLATNVNVPVIGIGAGVDCDGQVLVFHDALGMFDRFTPKFVRRFAEVGQIARKGLAEYAAQVRDGCFPGPEHSFGMEDEELRQIYGDLK